jgi:N-acetylglucosamine kinase-like BadF-type ATPase
MLLIAESGSTSTDWCLVAPAQRVFFRTRGINPFMESASDIAAMIKAELLPHLQFPPTAIVFYGAGCVHKGHDTVLEALTDVFRDLPIEVESDLLAAARALCGSQPGIACILGTGSNSCYYNGYQIESNVSPLGFIIGDEGSGAVLGKRFVGSLLKNCFSNELKELFLNSYHLTQADIIERVYRQPYPNRFLAGFAPFILENIQYAEVRTMVMDEFSAFIERNVMQYPQARHLPIHFTGSIAWHFSELLKESIALHHLQIGTICASPLHQLVSYHQQVAI